MARYRLITETEDDDGVLCSFDEMTGFYDSTFEEDGRRRVDILVRSYEPGDFLPQVLPDRDAETPDVTELEVLGRDETVLGRYFFFVSRALYVPEGLFVSAFMAGHAPLPEEEEIWELHRSGPLTSSDLWAPYGRRGRRAWTQVALRRHVRSDDSDRPDGATFELDGTFVTESAGFFCAIGEAVNGPGGYYGIGLDSLSDCMSGGYGTAGRFTLVWNDFEIARRAWTVGDPPDPSLDEVLELLERGGVTVERR
ncbi:barstar family protein [Spirillospora sp. NPDC048911]|uniref:barstar family protein n=1 Tax=Spirillospora sp. NPDC048911 TaxID=3364527 RepID=UPI0037235756